MKNMSETEAIKDEKLIEKVKGEIKKDKELMEIIHGIEKLTGVRDLNPFIYRIMIISMRTTIREISKEIMEFNKETMEIISRKKKKWWKRDVKK